MELGGIILVVRVVEKKIDENRLVVIYCQILYKVSVYVCGRHGSWGEIASN